MTYFYTHTQRPRLTIEADSLEYKALKLKKIKDEVDQLNIAYERSQEALSNIMKRQNAASKEYASLKKELIDAALDLECEDCDCDDNNCNAESDN